MSASILLGMFGIGQYELLIVAGVALLLFGHRLPSVMRSLGKGVVEFKKGVHGIEDESQADSESKPPAKSKSDE